MEFTIIDGGNMVGYDFKNGRLKSKSTLLDEDNESEIKNIAKLITKKKLKDKIFGLDLLGERLYTPNGCYTLKVGSFTPYEDPRNFLRTKNEFATTSYDLDDLDHGDIYEKDEGFSFFPSGLFRYPLGKTYQRYVVNGDDILKIENDFNPGTELISIGVTKNIQDPIKFYSETDQELLIEFDFFGQVFYYNNFQKKTFKYFELDGYYFSDGNKEYISPLSHVPNLDEVFNVLQIYDIPEDVIQELGYEKGEATETENLKKLNILVEKFFDETKEDVGMSETYHFSSKI